MTFYATKNYPAPRLSISKDTTGKYVLISFPSVTSGTYQLHYTSTGLALPVSTSWSTVSTNIVGDGTTKTFQRPIGSTPTYYSVSVH
jgi:hypothetical protein